MRHAEDGIIELYVADTLHAFYQGLIARNQTIEPEWEEPSQIIRLGLGINDEIIDDLVDIGLFKGVGRHNVGGIPTNFFNQTHLAPIRYGATIRRGKFGGIGDKDYGTCVRLQEAYPLGRAKFEEYQQQINRQLGSK